MANDIDYRAVRIDPKKDPADYHYTERRAEILALIEEKGHPRAVRQTDLADRYGVTPGQISQDFDRLRDYIVDTMDERRIDTITELVYRKAIKELMDDGEYVDAVKVVEKWNNWLFDKGKQDRAPRKTEADVRMSELSDTTDSYEILADDTAVEAKEGGIVIASTEDDNADGGESGDE